MFLVLIVVTIRVRNFLRRCIPTNILADATRTRRGIKWGLAVMPLAIPYFAAAFWFAGLSDQGAPGWVCLLVLLTIWNGFKMLWLGPASIARLIRACLREAGARRRQRRAARDAELTIKEGAPERAEITSWVGSPRWIDRSTAGRRTWCVIASVRKTARPATIGS